jgi:hypothetical protein
LVPCTAEGASIVVAPVVLIVSVEVPDPLFSVAGFNEHVGGFDVAMAPFRVMLLHDNCTLPLKPLFAAREIVEVAEPPADTDAGESVPDVIVNPATVRRTVVRFAIVPAVPVTDNE